MVQLTDSDLQSRGVVALGARRKMIKVFDMVKAQTPGSSQSLYPVYVEETP